MEQYFYATRTSRDGSPDAPRAPASGREPIHPGHPVSSTQSRPADRSQPNPRTRYHVFPARVPTRRNAERNRPSSSQTKPSRGCVRNPRKSRRLPEWRLGTVAGELAGGTRYPPLRAASTRPASHATGRPPLAGSPARPRRDRPLSERLGCPAGHGGDVAGRARRRGVGRARPSRRAERRQSSRGLWTRGEKTARVCRGPSTV